MNGIFDQQDSADGLKVREREILKMTTELESGTDCGYK